MSNLYKNGIEFDVMYDSTTNDNYKKLLIVEEYYMKIDRIEVEDCDKSRRAIKNSRMV